nr:MAG TPA: hypothetical protein [Inoviridae sp.]
MILLNFTNNKAVRLIFLTAFGLGRFQAGRLRHRVAKPLPGFSIA